MLRIAAPRSNSRCLLSTVIQQQTHLLGLKARSAPGRRTRSEGRNSAVGAPVCRHLITGPTHAHRHPRPDVIAKRDRAQEVFPGNSKLLASSQRRRNRGDTGMRSGRAVRIVSLVSVSQDSVGQRCFDGAAHDVRSDHRRNLFTPIGAHKFYRRPARTYFRTGNHRGQRIQNVMFRFLRYVLRQYPLSRLTHIPAELVHNRTHGLRRLILIVDCLSERCHRRDGPRCKRQTREFKQASPRQNRRATSCALILASVMPHSSSFPPAPCAKVNLLRNAGAPQIRPAIEGMSSTEANT